MKELRFWLKLFGLCVVLGGFVFFVVMRLALAGGNVYVPAIEGLPRANATLQLQKLGLKIKVIEERFSNEMPFGSVLEQDVEAGMTIKRGRRIKVVLSRGTRLVQVPELVGMRNARQARLLLEQNGLETGVVAKIYHDSPLGSIVAQSPEPGLEIPRGSLVSLLVSLQREKTAWVMPKLLGKQVALATGELKAMGLLVRKVALVQNEQAVPGSVLYQSISPGVRVQSGASLDLRAALGDPSTMKARFALVEYTVPDVGFAERRVQITVTDARGRRVVYNSMKKPGADVRVETKAWGGATYTISVAGRETLQEEIP